VSDGSGSPLDVGQNPATDPAMGSNKRKMESERATVAAKEAEARAGE
jgi:hypothetical protein